MYHLLPNGRPFLAGQDKRMKKLYCVKKENKSERVYSEKGGMEAEASMVSGRRTEERSRNPAVFPRWGKTSVPLSCIP